MLKCTFYKLRTSLLTCKATYILLIFLYIAKLHYVILCANPAFPYSSHRSTLVGFLLPSRQLENSTFHRSTWTCRSLHPLWNAPDPLVQFDFPPVFLPSLPRSIAHGSAISSQSPFSLISPTVYIFLRCWSGPLFLLPYSFFLRKLVSS